MEHTGPSQTAVPATSRTGRCERQVSSRLSLEMLTRVQPREDESGLVDSAARTNFRSIDLDVDLAPREFLELGAQPPRDRARRAVADLAAIEADDRDDFRRGAGQKIGEH